jgi:hypothetical protein
VTVESFSPAELDYSLLEGKWLLQYTDALDVVSQVSARQPSKSSTAVVVLAVYLAAAL